MSPDVNAPVMGPFERSHQHGPPLLGRVRGGQPVPRRPRSYAALRLPPSRRPRLRSSLAGGLPCPSATRRKKGLPGAWAVLVQRAVGSDPAGCASRLAHRVETASAFRLHHALGTQNERYVVAVNPTAHSLACLRIGVFVTADAARLAPGVGGSPFTGRVSHPLDGKQSFMTSPHRHSPLTSLAWSHRAPTPRALRRARTAHGTGPRARRLQDIESDTGHDTRRRVPDGARARMSQTERAFAPGAQLGRGVRSSSAVRSSIG